MKIKFLRQAFKTFHNMTPCPCFFILSSCQMCLFDQIHRLLSNSDPLLIPLPLFQMSLCVCPFSSSSHSPKLSSDARSSMKASVLFPREVTYHSVMQSSHSQAALARHLPPTGNVVCCFSSHPNRYSFNSYKQCMNG